MTNKKGSRDDLVWLKINLLGVILPSFQREVDMIRSQIQTLERKFKDFAAIDVIYRKNGTKVEGKIIEEGENHLKLKTRFGSATIPREEVDRIERGKGTEAEFPTRYAEAKGSVEKLTPLLVWCDEKKLVLQKQYVASQILLLDAANSRARSELGLGQPAIPGPK